MMEESAVKYLQVVWAQNIDLCCSHFLLTIVNFLFFCSAVMFQSWAKFFFVLSNATAKPFTEHVSLPRCRACIAFIHDLSF